MHFPTTSTLYILLALGPSALAGPSAPKPTDLACAGSVGPDGHCLYSTGSEQAQPQGTDVQPESVSVNLSEKKGGGGGGGGGHGGAAKGGKGGGGHGSGASNLECELVVVLLMCFITIMV